MSECEDRPRLRGFGPAKPHYFTSTWIVRRDRTPQRLDDIGLRIDPDYRPAEEFFEASIAGGSPDGVSLGSSYLCTVQDAMHLLRLVRHDPEPDDPIDVIERWSPDPTSSAEAVEWMSMVGECPDPPPLPGEVARELARSWWARCSGCGRSLADTDVRPDPDALSVLRTNCCDAPMELVEGEPPEGPRLGSVSA
jgi:hypothetical protein